MKTVYLVRHATAVGKKKSLPDFERSLTDKGTKEARQIARRFAKQKIKPTLLISSPANRALGVWHDAEVSLSQLTSFLRDDAVSPLFDPNAYKAFGRHLESERDSNLQRFREVWKQHGDLFRHREQIATSL